MCSKEKLSSIVRKINKEIYDCVGETDFYCNIEYLTNGTDIVIRFGDYHLWDSEDDEREWHDGEKVGDEWQEPLELYVRKELMKFLDVLRKIKV